MPKVSSEDLFVRRSEILEGARRCFAEYGYEGATVVRLEEATGKSRGAIFHHFGDKEKLFLALAQLDAETMADVVSKVGLVDVMRGMLENPGDYDWLATRLEIHRQLRTDSQFRERWLEHQRVLDDAVLERLRHNAEEGRLRTDFDPDVVHTFLVTVLEGFITRLAINDNREILEQMLDLVELTVRGQKKEIT